jgi:hypothetical protein
MGSREPRDRFALVAESQVVSGHLRGVASHSKSGAAQQIGSEAIQDQ